MESINRQVMVIKPKHPYVKWINSLPDMDDDPCIIDSMNDDCTAILLPHFDDRSASLKFLKKIYKQLFEIELEGWSTDENTWPKKRSFSLFCEWFQLEFHSEVLDFGAGPICIDD